MSPPDQLEQVCNTRSRPVCVINIERKKRNEASQIYNWDSRARYWTLYREWKYIAWQMSQRTAHDRAERKKWQKAGTKQTRPLHQTANSEVVCSRWTLRATRERAKTTNWCASERARNSRKKGKAIRESDCQQSRTWRPFRPPLASFFSFRRSFPRLVRYLF